MKQKPYAALIAFCAIFLSGCYDSAPYYTEPTLPEIPENPDNPSIPDIPDNTSRLFGHLDLTHVLHLSIPASHQFSLRQFADFGNENLIAVEKLQSYCPDLAFDSQTLNLTMAPSEPNICVYRYQLEGKEPAFIYTRITDSNKARPTISLPEVTLSAEPNQTITVDILKPLHDQNIAIWHNQIDPQLIVVGKVTAQVINGPKIELTPDADFTSARIFYQLRSSDGYESFAGMIYLNRTDPTAEAGLVASPFELTANTGQAQQINVLEHITGATPIQLRSVHAINAQVKLSETCSTCFDFYADYPGTYKVRYEIGDEQGNTASANATVTIDNEWQHINDSIILIAPPTLPQIQHLKFNISEVSQYENQNGGRILLPQLSQQDAAQYCSELCLKLPTASQLVDFAMLKGDAFAKYKWPVNVGYWAKEANLQVSLADGREIDTTSDAGYVTCSTTIKNIELSINPANVQVGDTQQLTATIITEANIRMPSDALGGVVWESSSPSVISVDEKGRITALSEGSSAITTSYQGVVSNAVQMLVNPAPAQ